ATSRGPSKRRWANSRWPPSPWPQSSVFCSARSGSHNPRDKEERTLFAGLIQHAREAASHLLLRYVARASVAVPFIVALGFAIAAVAVMLVDRFGHVTAYWIMAARLAILGVLAAIVVSVKEHEE